MLLLKKRHYALGDTSHYLDFQIRVGLGIWLITHFFTVALDKILIPNATILQNTRFVNYSFVVAVSNHIHSGIGPAPGFIFCESYQYDETRRVTEVYSMHMHMLKFLSFLFQIGEKITVILDMEDNTLAFERDYEYLGVAFRGLPQTRLYPSISAVYGNTEVTMVYKGNPMDG